MVYGIRPYANNRNRGIDLEYEQSPKRLHSWLAYMRKEQPIPKESAPTVIFSQRPTPLPDAFEINVDVWCVSARLRSLMEKLFGSQVGFYEVPVVVKADNAQLPSIHFVTFSQFRSFIDWPQSKVKALMRSSLAPDVETIMLADAPDAAVFKPVPKDQETIWIEKMLRQGDRLFMPGFNVYASDVAARAIADAFPDIFIVVKHQEIEVDRAI